VRSMRDLLQGEIEAVLTFESAQLLQHDRGRDHAGFTEAPRRMISSNIRG